MKPPEASAPLLSHNLRRLMAKEGLTHTDVVAATGLDERTIRGILRSRNKPHARTVNRLATGLGVNVEELLLPPLGMSAEAFDAATNPLVEQAVADHAEAFDGWSSEDFSQLRGQVGIGGPLTEAGVLAAASAINDCRSYLAKARVVLEGPDADVLSRLIDLLYDNNRLDE